MSRAIANIIEIDGSEFEYTNVIYVNTITIHTSANAPNLQINDKNDVPVIRLSGAVDGRRLFVISFAKPQRIENLSGKIWTNIERVVIFIDKFGE